MNRHWAESNQSQIPLTLKTAYNQITATVNSSINKTLKDSRRQKIGVPHRGVGHCIWSVLKLWHISTLLWGMATYKRTFTVTV
ncbi:hypothetical protein NPIL_285221 [Nephila pilipes]|uniref:Uncharacterized protein n=1 Tax=Nephila pilipes TaxID=299642 RepID=A0A8X6R6V2_NEPPI|nr:hypothetical protein NPIL_285221 [Nephila pilipes]